VVTSVRALKEKVTVPAPPVNVPGLALVISKPLKPCSPVLNVEPYPAVLIGTAFVAAVPVVDVNLTATVAATVEM
jgi:hypothetical protein